MMKRNISAVIVLILIAFVTAALFVASVYVGPFTVPRISASYGGSGFTTGDGTYPRQATDAENYAVTIARPTHRISSEYWSIDDYVYSVAAPQDVVSVSESAYDRSFSNIYKFAESYHPAITTDPETVLKLNPDLLLVASSGRADFTDLMRTAGTPTFRMFTDFTSLDEIDRTILLTGYLTGNNATASRVHETFKEAIRRAQAKRPATAPSPRVLGYTTGYGYGDHTVFNDIVTVLGAINVGAENGLHGYSLINPEQVVVWDPEWIISGAARGATHDALQRLLEDPAVAQTTAARKGQILVFENNIFLPLSPFTTQLIDALGDALYATKS
jgi:iron complex transport system substrate-binding protein